MRTQAVMKITSEALAPKGALLAVDGDVNLDSSPQLRATLREHTDRRTSPLVVDLSRVAFMDSSGLATLVDALHAVEKYGGSLRLFGLSRRLQGVFQVSKLTRIFDIRADRGEAVRD